MKTFIKWVGSKRQTAKTIETLIGPIHGTYYEPFVGGGSVLLRLLPSQAVVNDTNRVLTIAYECFLNDELYSAMLEKLVEFEAKHGEEFYYKTRAVFNQTNFIDNNSKPDVAATFIYLNKASYNGVYRINRYGEYNVPFGHADTLKVIDKNTCDKIHQYMMANKITVLNCDFESVVKDAKEGDVVYFDPPYDVFDGQPMYHHYSSTIFTKDDQVRLKNVVQQLTDKNVRVIVSNSNTEFIKELYKDFKFYNVSVMRVVANKNKFKGRVTELLIDNEK